MKKGGRGSQEKDYLKEKIARPELVIPNEIIITYFQLAELWLFQIITIVCSTSILRNT